MWYPWPDGSCCDPQFHVQVLYSFVHDLAAHVDALGLKVDQLSVLILEVEIPNERQK